MDNKSPTTTDLEAHGLKAEHDHISSSESINSKDVMVEDYVTPRSVTHFIKKLALAGVKIRGVEPVPPSQRSYTRYYNIFTLFGGSFISVLP